MQQMPPSTPANISWPIPPIPPAEPKTQVVWHYTRHETLAKILGNHTMWATDVAYMNDLDEISTGIRVFRKVLRKMRHQLLSPKDQMIEPDWDQVRDLVRDSDAIAYAASAFAIAFSRDGDDNAQWDRYADRDGFAIGFRQGACMPVLGEEAAGPGWWVSDEPLRWRKMIYNKRTQKSACGATIRSMWNVLQQNHYPDKDLDFTDFIENQALAEFSDVVSMMKNRGFRAEREVRYIVERPDDSAIHQREPSFGRLDQTPYVKVTGAPSNVTENDERNWPRYQNPAHPLPLPVEKVKLGPKLKGKAIRRHVKYMLAQWEYPHVEVMSSKSTIR